MKKLIYTAFIVLFAIAGVACKKKDSPAPAIDKNLGFFPLQVGNYWRINSDNYAEIKEKKILNGKEYFHYQALVGGDAFDNAYYRIDGNKLIQGYNFYTDVPEVLIADFNEALDEVFYATTILSNPNNIKITVIEKSEDTMKFKYEESVSGKPNIYFRTFRKGVGLDEKYDEIKINGVVYKF
ncbi:hypothetical protein [Solitalea lacus]|uniref:hypothetical protein n=1 Tax=Solitalea lacus TaxID=2911172 RepID=UPI001EDC4BD4|nr:hypothetical protein [Solitalea lacus]UKJ06513.1 hypothetical protein L2B55_13340 [Solitalea lacus]